MFTCLDNVSGCARDVGDYGSLATAECIQQAALAHVGAAHQSNLIEIRLLILEHPNHASNTLMCWWMCRIACFDGSTCVCVTTKRGLVWIVRCYLQACAEQLASLGGVQRSAHSVFQLCQTLPQQLRIHGRQILVKIYPSLHSSEAADITILSLYLCEAITCRAPIG